MANISAVSCRCRCCVGLTSLRGLMCPSMNISTGEVQWVKTEHAEDWRKAHITPLPPTPTPALSNTGMGSCVSISNHVDSGIDLPVHTSTSPAATLHDESSPLNHHHRTIDQTQFTGHMIDTIAYDPWVVVARPAVSAADCEDVNALKDWLHHGPAHIRASIAEAFAVALVSEVDLEGVKRNEVKCEVK
jgi:hypothetical protein